MKVPINENGVTKWVDIPDDNNELIEYQPTIEDIQIKITDLKNQVQELETQVNNMS